MHFIYFEETVELFINELIKYMAVSRTKKIPSALTSGQVTCHKKQQMLQIASMGIINLPGTLKSSAVLSSFLYLSLIKASTTAG